MATVRRTIRLDNGDRTLCASILRHAMCVLFLDGDAMQYVVLQIGIISVQLLWCPLLDSWPCCLLEPVIVTSCHFDLVGFCFPSPFRGPGGCGQCALRKWSHLSQFHCFFVAFLVCSKDRVTATTAWQDATMNVKSSTFRGVSDYRRSIVTCDASRCIVDPYVIDSHLCEPATSALTFTLRGRSNQPHLIADQCTVVFGVCQNFRSGIVLQKQSIWLMRIRRNLSEKFVDNDFNFSAQL